MNTATRDPDPQMPRTFDEIPAFGEFTRKVGRKRVPMLKDSQTTARLAEDVPRLMRGEACPVYTIHGLERMLD